MMDGMTTASQTTYTNAEMFELVRMHFDEAFSDRDYTKWDWSLPLYLIEGATGWTQARLEGLVDSCLNGSSRCR